MRGQGEAGRARPGGGEEHRTALRKGEFRQWCRGDHTTSAGRGRATRVLRIGLPRGRVPGRPASRTSRPRPAVAAGCRAPSAGGLPTRATEIRRTRPAAGPDTPEPVGPGSRRPAPARRRRVPAIRWTSRADPPLSPRHRVCCRQCSRRDQCAQRDRRFAVGPMLAETRRAATVTATAGGTGQLPAVGGPRAGHPVRRSQAGARGGQRASSRSGDGRHRALRAAGKVDGRLPVPGRTRPEGVRCEGASRGTPPPVAPVPGTAGTAVPHTADGGRTR